jgi:integrase
MSKLTRRQISSNKGKELLLKFLENEKPRTRRFSNAMLKSVWSYGLNLPYPIDSRRDLGKLPKVGRRCSPPDALIEQWARAVEKEEDLYLKLLVMSVMLHGWRPSHVCKLKQRNVRLDAGGMPVAIIANGYDEGFKTNAPIIAHLCENYSNSLMEFRKCLNSTLPERPLLPFRSTTGVVSLDREMTVDGFSRQWGRFRKKHCLPKLRPVDLRHWTASVYRRAGLSKVASAAFLGHYPSYGGSMRDWYDSPQDEDILREQQERLPDGTLGFLFPKIEITQGIPEEMLGVLGDYIAGKIGTMDMASQMETFRLRLLEKPISNAQL